MASILVLKNNDEFEIYSFRSEEETMKKAAEILPENQFVLHELSRNSVQQIERYFRRMLTPEYFKKLQTEPAENERIRRLYEIGARR